MLDRREDDVWEKNRDQREKKQNQITPPALFKGPPRNANEYIQRQSAILVRRTIKPITVYY